MQEIDFKKIIEVGVAIEPKFVLEENQKGYYSDLFKYFSETHETLDTKKGLLISGNMGTGKTLSMQIMQRLFGMKIVSCRHLVREFLQSKVHGMDVLDLYGRESFHKNGHGNKDIHKPIHICFDDLGLEEVNAQMYGNKQNILAEVLLDRYETFGRYGMKTYATTNLKAAALEELYGPRVRDRMREMMNYVQLEGDSKRK